MDPSGVEPRTETGALLPASVLSLRLVLVLPYRPGTTGTTRCNCTAELAAGAARSLHFSTHSCLAAAAATAASTGCSRLAPR